MESLEELSDMKEDKSPKQLQKSHSLLWRIKDIQASKTQNYFTETKKVEAILIQVAFSVGLGSMWRFPYLCHLNEGGGFILTYFLTLLFLGVPLLYMEMVIGQWLHMDSIRVWKHLVSWLGGVGYASILVCTLVSLYNSTLISWSFSYLVNSFYHPLPWNRCPLQNISVTDFSCLQTVSHQHFWYHSILQASGHIEEGVEVLVLRLSLGVFAAWVFLFMLMVIGIKSPMPVSTLTSLDLWRQAGGHVLYSLGLGMGTIATFPSYNTAGNECVKIALFVALVSLVTSVLTTSIIFLVLGFWASNSGQACVEKSVLMLMKLISKGILPQAAKPPKDILLRPPLDYLDWISTLPQHLQYQVIRLSLSCAITVQKGKIMEGPGLSYAAFSQAVSLFPGASFWAIVFFLALFITGLGTLIRLSEGIVLPLQNTIPIFIKHPKVVPVIVCLGGLLSSLVFSSEAGSYIMCLVDDHVVPLTIAVIMIFQNMGLAWIYGAKRFRQEIFSKLGHLLLPIFTFLWCYVTLPGLLGLLAICLVQLYHRGTPYYVAWNSSASQEVRQPYLKRDLGWVTFLSILTLLPIPVYLLHHWWYFHDPIVSDTSKKPQSFRKTAMRLTKPLQWPKRPMGKSQNKGSKTSVRALSPPTTKVQDVDSWQPTDKDLKEGQLERSLVHSVSD
ncbi:orphan sodium- and chloride-dependent neurotransmitter transporter NTT5 isoform X2 [Tupaia chinensis]|uniref:orphan sodium- and chloride-dependent neurotransmitter transporter NTT5 isoform X2 n=1 Tax=Tupaia chinensis TaxID=246437 RepID=UPI0003C8DA62|nr:orphan sodium- and chloride-dependent neurotransmitter transporter NTT5 isoform X2 [Tupaia chinensis]